MADHHPLQPQQQHNQQQIVRSNAQPNSLSLLIDAADARQALSQQPEPAKSFNGAGHNYKQNTNGIYNLKEQNFAALQQMEAIRYNESFRNSIGLEEPQKQLLSTNAYAQQNAQQPISTAMLLQHLHAQQLQEETIAQLLFQQQKQDAQVQQLLHQRQLNSLHENIGPLQTGLKNSSNGFLIQDLAKGLGTVDVENGKNSMLSSMQLNEMGILGLVGQQPNCRVVPVDNSNIRGNGANVGGITKKQSQDFSPKPDDNQNQQQMPNSSNSMTILVPCRARGMPVEHNPKTAHFRISEDMQHGTELVCSFPACRRAGIKFCYCAFCQTPVAKRNFRKRHMHDDEKNTAVNSSRKNSMEEKDDKGENTTISKAKDDIRNRDNDFSQQTSNPGSGNGSNGGMRVVTLPLKRFAVDHAMYQVTNNNANNADKNEATEGKVNEFDNIPKRSLHKKQRQLNMNENTCDINQDNLHQNPKVKDKRALNGKVPANIEALDSKKESDHGINVKANENGHEQVTFGDAKITNLIAKALRPSAGASMTDHDDTLSNDLSSLKSLPNCNEKTLRTWIRLLFTRPNTSDQSKMSDWLLQVISVANITSEEGSSPDRV